MSIETVVQLTEEADTVTSWSSLERLDDLADIAVMGTPDRRARAARLSPRSKGG
jgi:hypothetical protein